MSVVAFMVLLGVGLAVGAAALVAAVAGYLIRRSGGSYPAAVLGAGAAFGATLGVVATVTGAVAAVAALLR
ncbi:hypothetical protein ACWC4A_38030 [Streptomyces mirabilis]|uniref:hypothetical protein n=1 Tax=Streptomyces mirabilis TaxID=68239 RepID=UPI0036E8314A